MADAETLKTEIETLIKTNRVVLFMKGSPDFPMCGFSGRVAQILQNLGVPFEHVDVIDRAEMRDAVKAYSQWPTLPQLFVDGQLVGGCDITTQLFESGDLQKMLVPRP